MIIKNIKKIKTKKDRIKNVVLYIGWSRAEGDPDPSKKLIQDLNNSQYNLKAVILKEGDPLNDFCHQYNIPVLYLPPILCGKIDEIKQYLTLKRRPELLNWRKKLKSYEPDLGVVIWGNWIPPIIFKTPENGFINYHPAPLPDLRGYEPETMAIIEGRKSISGTVHRVAKGFDTGKIICYSDELEITEFDTAESILYKLANLAPQTLIRAINILSRHENPGRFQIHEKASLATKTVARKESLIKWTRDSHEMILRRYKAFCGQKVDIPLKAVINDQIFQILSLELHKIENLPGYPGDTIGYYSGNNIYNSEPIIKTTEGAAVVKTGIEFKHHEQKESEVNILEHEILKPKAIINITKTDEILNSIDDSLV